MTDAAALITQLGLQPLPHEGGFFARTWTSPVKLPDGRPAGTAIYFLLTPESFSALHRVDADELWHFHAGDAVEHVQLRTGAPALVTTLGTAFAGGQIPQLCVPRDTWQGARLSANIRHGWALLSCTMIPGWVDAGFTLGKLETLLRDFPSSAPQISALIRDY